MYDKPNNTETNGKTYRCKHCKVEVVSKSDFHPKLGKGHGKHCPRRRMFG